MRVPRTVVALAAIPLLFAGCGSGDGETDPQPSGDQRTFPGGQKLAHYRGMGSYQWRVGILDHRDELLAAMRAVNPDLDQGDFSDVVSTCDAIARGTTGAALTRDTGVRFNVEAPGDAKALLRISRRYACP